MAEFLSLPTEILQRIFSYADQASRKALRLTNRLLGNVGQQFVFQTTGIRPTRASYVRLEKILDRPDLASLVTKIYFETFASDEDVEVGRQEDEDSDDELDEEIYLPLRFVRVLDRLKDLPRLQSVVLRFHPECSDSDYMEADQDIDFRSSVMERAMAALAGLPRPLQELAIRDLQNVNETDKTTVANITKILGGLKSLRLNITNENRGMSGESDVHKDAPQRFFAELPSFWLKPALSSLEHLTLYSSLYFGFYPQCDLRGLHFPRLKTLSFGNYVFVHDSQLQCILSHSATLTELYLDDCAILWEVAVDDPTTTYLSPSDFRPHENLRDRAYAAYDKRWADYFRAFKDGLPHLRQFRYGHAPNWWDDDTTPFESETQIEIGFHRESYMVFCDGTLPSEHTESITYRVPKGGDGDGFTYVNGEPLKPSDDDRVALKELCDKFGLSVTLEDEDY